jgi:hypothetical protein
VRGSSGQLILDFTSNLPLTNRFDIINFSTDGTTGPPKTQGEEVTGDLVQNSFPAKHTRVKANTFFTELALPFVAYGDFIEFTINVSETKALNGRPPDEFSLFLLDSLGRSLAARANPDGKPDMSITVTGVRGGQLKLLTDPVVAGGSSVGPGPDDQPDSNNSTEESTSVLFPRPIMAPAPEVAFNVTPAFTQDNPALLQEAQTFVGNLTEFCNRRCAANKAICTGGAFGLAVDETTFYSFDDVGNLMAQVALVDSGQNPQKEGAFGGARVVGVLKDSVLTVLRISVF